MDEHLLEAIGGIIAVLITVIGVLLNRSIGHMDETMKSLSADHKMLSADMQELKADSSVATQLRDFQDRRIENLEKEKRTLHRAFREMDNLIFQKFGESVRLHEEE